NSLESPEEMRKVTAAVPRPVKINIIEGHPASRCSTDDLFGFGFKIVGYAGFMQRAAGKAMLAAINTLGKERTTEAGLRQFLMTPAERYEVLGVEKYKTLEARLF